MISPDMIGRIYEHDKATGLVLGLISTCIQKPTGEKVSPDEIVSMYEKLSPLASKMAEQIEAGEKTRNKNLEKDRILNIAVASPFSSAYSPTMRITPR